MGIDRDSGQVEDHYLSTPNATGLPHCVLENLGNCTKGNPGGARGGSSNSGLPEWHACRQAHECCWSEALWRSYWGDEWDSCDTCDKWDSPDEWRSHWCFVLAFFNALAFVLGLFVVMMLKSARPQVVSLGKS